MTIQCVGAQLPQTHQNAIYSTRTSTSLRVAQCCHTGIKFKPLGKNLLNVICAQWFQILVMSAFGDDNDCLAFSKFTMLITKNTSAVYPGINETYALNLNTHFILPRIRRRGALGYENEISATTTNKV